MRDNKGDGHLTTLAFREVCRCQFGGSFFFSTAVSGLSAHAARPTKVAPRERPTPTAFDTAGPSFFRQAKMRERRISVAGWAASRPKCDAASRRWSGHDGFRSFPRK